jgi:hypothetical protein
MQYADALQEAGLSVRSDPFMPGLTIKDGQVFAQWLTTVPNEEGYEALREGAQNVVITALAGVKFANIPTIVDREYPGYFLEAQFRPDNVADLEEYNQATAQLLIHTQEIADNLDCIDADPTVARDLRNAQTAEVEGMLPAWAMAHHLGVYDPPTTDIQERVWTQLIEPEEWEVLAQFLEQASEETPPGSNFIQTLARAMEENIRRLRTSDLEPSRRPALPPIEDVDDDDFMDQIMEDPEAIAAAEEWRRQYENTLSRVEQRIQQVLDRNSGLPEDAVVVVSPWDDTTTLRVESVPEVSRPQDVEVLRIGAHRVTINNLHDDRSHIDEILREVQSAGPFDSWQPIGSYRDSNTGRQYRTDVSTDSEQPPRYFAKTIRMPRSEQARVGQDDYTGASEVIISDRVKRAVASREAQESATYHGFAGVSYVDPIAVVDNPDTGNRTIVYPYIGGEVLENYETLEMLEAFASDPSSVRLDLTREQFDRRTKLYRTLEDLSAILEYYGIDPDDIGSDQFIMQRGPDGKIHLHLIDAETYRII